MRNNNILLCRFLIICLCVIINMLFNSLLRHSCVTLCHIFPLDLYLEPSSSLSSALLLQHASSAL